MKKIFSDKEIEYIINNYQNKTYKQITKELNKFNEVKKSDKQVRTKASVLGLSKAKHKYNRRYFEKINTKDRAYWLGFIFTDGYIQYRKYDDGRSTSEVGIELKKCDENHLLKFIRAIEGNVKIKTRITKDRVIKGSFTKGGTYMSQIRLFSKEMVDDLLSLNVVPNKTYKQDYPVVDEELFWDFLRGVVDGDGCIHKNSGLLKITNPNIYFLEYLQNFLKTNGFESYIKKEEEWKYNLFLKHSSVSLLDNIYKDSHVYLERKYAIYKKLKQRGLG